MGDKIAGQIKIGADKGNKRYGYDSEHDSGVPADYWFQQSQEGLILFVVFYTQACRWNRCLGCNLPSKMSLSHVDYKAIIGQIDHLFCNPEVVSRAGEIRKLIVSNNGSVLDEATFSSTALMYLLAKVNLTLPNLEVLNLETRPEYVDLAELEFIARALQEGDTPTKLELAVGFEAFDDRIRNDYFQKGLDKTTFEAFVSKIAPYNFSLKCYFMQKPVPGMTDSEAVDDIQQGIRYLGHLARYSGVAINMHLNPTYAAYGTPLEEAFRSGDFLPPRLVDVARAALVARDYPLSLFIGLFDEGLAVEGGSFVRPGEQPLVELLEQFNRTQNYTCLEAVVASA